LKGCCSGGVVQPGERERLERLCRYALRPPIAQARLRLDPGGHVWMTLRHRWADGTTHLRFDPVALLARLAVLIPRPRINLVLYYGLLAPRAPWRAEVVASAGSDWSDEPPGGAGARGDDVTAPPSRRRPSAYLWADLMRRTFGMDVLECPRCGGRLRLLALIEQTKTVERILRHLGLPTYRPETRPPRAPPLPVDDPACQLGAPADAAF
jgi:hypothetical protein